MKFKLVFTTLLAAILLILPALPALEGYAAAPPDESRSVTAPTGYGDDGRWEVGVEYVNWYPGSGDLYKTDDDALSLYYQLGRGGWTKRFAYGNRWAWEEDWKASWRGGTEYRYVDSVDLAYFSGHGGSAWDSYYWRWLNGPVFGDGGRNHDDPYLLPGDARRAWGNGDLEWVAFSACQTLNNRSRRYWAASMNGLHLLLGFKTNMYDVNQGQEFGKRIRWGWTIPQAWFGATDATHPHHSVQARILANELCHYYYDKWGRVCTDSYDWDYWYIDHWAGSEQALQVDPASLNYEMPTLNVVSAAPSDDYLTGLATSFGFSPNTPAALDDELQLYRTTEYSLDLTVDPQGMFSFINLGKLWTGVTETVKTPARPLSLTDTRQLADDFLAAHNLMPADAEFYEVVSDTITAAQLAEVPSDTIKSLGVTHTFTDVQETISTTAEAVRQVIYSRHIVYTATNGTPVTFSVQGPGARLKVYVNSQGEIVGAMGGWRAVDDIGVLDTVSILTPTQVISLYKALGDAVNLTPTPFRADALTVTRSTVGYYEQPLGTAQASLEPVYILDLNLNSSEGDTLSSTAFIPAAAGLLPPLAAVTSITEEAPMVSVGQVITLTAADASQPLSALGYGNNLNFTMGQAPYTYTWKFETGGQVIGVGSTVTVTAGIADDLGVNKNNDVPMVIILEVTDAAGHTSRVSQPFYFVGATPSVQRVYLPAILKP